ncbi:hypothetical protein SAMN05661093_11108 [Kibdelosporangium aridum]|uniref:Ig-like domain-containing protein n=1 Tax=Kibdelosporangium aridum TaxID=2030 RepID=A0A1W2G037_KIBAR|nr:hypothetical protein SAMN05661093_11108 [Kibdelosporangium aridum]
MDRTGRQQTSASGVRRTPFIAVGVLVALVGALLSPLPGAPAASARPAPDIRADLVALRGALPPTIAIKAPANGATLDAGRPNQFRAVVYDDGRGTPTITWRRGNGAVLGTGNPISAALPPGAHEVTATAVFPDGVTATDRILVVVVNHAPTVAITSPRHTSWTSCGWRGVVRLTGHRAGRE